MPNWCDNTIKITGNAEDIKLFNNENIKDKELNFNILLPLNEDYTTQEAIDVWGTKWEPDTLYYSNNVNEIFISFSTPWTPPMAYYIFIVNRYKDTSLKFEIDYFEGGCAFSGEFKASSGDTYDEIYLEYSNEKDKYYSNLDYFSYIIKKEHESQDYIFDSIITKLEDDINNKDFIEILTERYESGEVSIEELAELFLQCC